jgi:hypothetical protein
MLQHDTTDQPDSVFTDGDWEVQYSEGHLYITSVYQPDQQVHLQPKAVWNLLEHLFNSRGDLYNRAMCIPEDDYPEEDRQLLRLLEKAAGQHGSFLDHRCGKLELVLSRPFEPHLVAFAHNRLGLMAALGWMTVRGWIEEQ